MNSELNTNDLQRYSRHILLSGVGKEGQLRLKKAKVLVIGAGGLGSPVLLYLASAGVGAIGIADGDQVDISNLQRQVIFSSEDVGKNKAEAAAARIGQTNPLIRTMVHPLHLTSANALEVIRGYDLIIDGTDNFPTRYLVNDACILLDKPLVFGSIFKFEGQVSVFNYKGGPTYRCLFPAPPGPGEVPNCSEVGVLGVLPGMIGTMMANEALKLLLGIGDVLSGKLFVLDALTMSTRILNFSRDERQCKIHSLIDYEDFCGSKPMAQEISPADLRDLRRKDPNLVLIDVREESEYRAGNLGGILIPLGEVAKQQERIPRSGTVVVHCKGGSRSRKAIELLRRDFGFTNLVNLSGGYDACRGVLY